MSDIYGSLYRILRPGRFKGDIPNPLRLALGTAWENHLEYLLQKNGVEVWRPGELLTAEGVAYSPDGLMIGPDGRLIVVEYKLTWMSSREDFSAPKYDKYKTQAMAYCGAVGTPYARFYITHVNGAGGFKLPEPELRAYDVEFTDRELHETSDMLLNHARHERLL